MTSREKQLNRSPEGQMEMLTHHVAYEIDMMRGTYICLAGPAHVWFSGVVVNAILESFCIHARNLIEFFLNDDGPTDETAAARHFTKKDYQPFPSGPPPEKLVAKLHKQIAHPSYGRTKRDDEKIGADERERLMRLIDGEVANFELQLRSTYAAKWPAKAAQRVTKELPTASATNTISLV